MSLNSELVEVAQGRRHMWADEFVDRFVSSSRDEQVEVLDGVLGQVVISLKEQSTGSYIVLDELIVKALGILVLQRVGAEAELVRQFIIKVYAKLPVQSKSAILDLLDSLVDFIAKLKRRLECQDN